MRRSWFLLSSCLWTLAAGCSHLGDLESPAMRDGSTPPAVEPPVRPQNDASVPAETERQSRLPAASDGEWEVFSLDGGVESPVENIIGVVAATSADGGIVVTLEAEGLPPNISLGLFLHQFPCAQQQGGPVYAHGPTSDYDSYRANTLGDYYRTTAEGSLNIRQTRAWTPKVGGVGSAVLSDLGGSPAAPNRRLACTNLPI